MLLYELIYIIEVDVTRAKDNNGHHYYKSFELILRELDAVK